MHWAYIQWEPEFELVHDATYETEHSVKTCKAKHPEFSVELDCDAALPELIRHAVCDPSKDRVLTLARIFALEELPCGTDWKIVYIGEVAS